LDTPIEINVLGNDADVDTTFSLLLVEVCTGPVNGTITVNSTTQAITYTPDVSFNGLDLFTYKVLDGVLNSSCANVSITVTPGVCVCVGAALRINEVMYVVQWCGGVMSAHAIGLDCDNFV
jgi:hypothetical protein